MGSALDFIQNRGTTSSTITAGKPPTAMSIIQQYGNKQPTVKATVKTPTKTVSSQVKVTQPTPTPMPKLTGIQQAQKTLGDIGNNIGKTLENVVKGINMTLTPPKIAPKLPDSAFATKVTQTQPVQIKPGQKTLTPEQLNPIVGKQPEQTQLKAAPKATIWDNITNTIGRLFTSDNTTKALAANAVAVKKTVGKNLDLGQLAEKPGNPLKNTLMEEVTKQLGIRNSPSTSEVGQVIMTLALGTGLIEVPLQTLKVVGTFAGVNEIKSGIITALTGKQYKVGSNQSLSDLVPDAPGDVKNVLDLVDFLGTAKISEKVMNTYPAIMERLTKDIITKYNLPQEVTITGEQLRDIHQTGKLTTAEEKAFILDLKKNGTLTEEQYQDLLSNKKGITVSVPSEKLVTMADKPWWAKVKEIFKVEPSIPTKTQYINGETKVSAEIKGLLGEGEKTPSEVINTVMKSGLEKTPEGKAVMKAAAEANSKGMNITIEKPIPVEELKTMTPEQKQTLVDKRQTDSFIKADTEQPKVLRIGGEYAKLTPEQSVALRNEVKLIPEGTKEQLHLNLESKAVGANETKLDLTTMASKYPDVKKALTNAGIEIKPKSVSVPREQLPVGKGEIKATALEARIKGAQDLVKDATPEQLKALGLEETNTAHNDQQLADAAKYVATNQEDAIRVLQGEIPAPKGLLRNAILSAMVDQGNKDVGLATKLSGLFSKRYGQEIQILSTINPNSPVKLLSDIYKIREAQVQKRYGGKTVNEVSTKLEKKMKDVAKKAKKYDWDDFISSIDTC